MVSVSVVFFLSFHHFSLSTVSSSFYLLPLFSILLPLFTRSLLTQSSHHNIRLLRLPFGSTFCASDLFASFSSSVLVPRPAHFNLLITDFFIELSFTQLFPETYTFSFCFSTGKQYISNEEGLLCCICRRASPEQQCTRVVILENRSREIAVTNTRLHSDNTGSARAVVVRSLSVQNTMRQQSFRRLDVVTVNSVRQE